MSFWSFIETALDWIRNWRWYICFWGSIILAGVVASSIPYQPLQWIAAGSIFIMGVVIGFRWDRSN